jgi:NADP-dependent 3-hydroxy acid dehydrogenase YdfG
MDQHLENKVCLITGATNGIGEESAKELNKMGAEIIFIARSEEKGNKLKEAAIKRFWTRSYNDNCGSVLSRSGKKSCRKILSSQ